MNKFNKKKLFYFEKKFFYSLLILVIFFLFFFYIYNNFYKLENFIVNSVKKISNELNYTLEYYDINDLNYIKHDNVVKSIQPYINTSIFLLPLDEISKSILENTWVENLELKTNYKNKIFINIKEYEPIGIYYFNNNNYYFKSQGKIIDYINSADKNISEFIIFTGQNSTINALNLLNILKEIKKDFIKDILKANYIKNRRWDLFLKGNIKLKLSEENLKKSIENYFKLIINLSHDDLINIKIIDLRDLQKAIIEYK